MPNRNLRSFKTFCNSRAILRSISPFYPQVRRVEDGAVGEEVRARGCQRLESCRPRTSRHDESDRPLLQVGPHQNILQIGSLGADGGVEGRRVVGNSQSYPGTSVWTFLQRYDLV